MIYILAIVLIGNISFVMIPWYLITTGWRLHIEIIVHGL